MVFKKMSIAGVAYGSDHSVCDDLEQKGVTNFEMIDSKLD
jgi:hypothetical protein